VTIISKLLKLAGLLATDYLRRRTSGEEVTGKISYMRWEDLLEKDVSAFGDGL